MICTTKSTILIGGRFPGIGLQVSRDSGMTLKYYRIDTGIWENGAMFEVAPNVILFIYGGKNHPQQMRRQLIRVTQDGLEPVLEALTN